MTILTDDQSIIADVFTSELFQASRNSPSSLVYSEPESLVPSSWPDPNDHRLAYDRTASGFYFILEDDLTPTAMTGAQVVDLNNEDEDTAITVTAASGVKTKVFGLVLGEPTNITGYMVVCSDVTESFLRVEQSLDTTDGMDGTWTLVTASVVGGFTDGAVSPEFRLRVTGLGGVTNAVGLRFKTNGSTDIHLSALHLYGSPGTLADVDRLTFWDPSSDAPASVNMLNFGDSPRRSSADKRFRVKNASATLVEAAVTLAVESLTSGAPGPDPHQMLLLSKDNGRTFSASVNIGTLAPDQVSQVIILRRVIPTTAELGTWAARVYVSGSGGDLEAVEYAYFGDVSTNTPTPHLWYVYPPSGIAGTQVDVVGMGLGDTAPEYSGDVRYGGVPQSPLGWARTAAGAHAYDASRAIQAPNDVVNVEHQRITVDVPDPAVDDYFTVETNA